MVSPQYLLKLASAYDLLILKMLLRRTWQKRTLPRGFGGHCGSIQLLPQ
jgi:hypothetical protein